LNDLPILEAVISAYRKVIFDRYDYQNLKLKYSIPDTLSENKFNDLRTYFLTHIYPPPEQRAQLNDAFDNLENHINNPKYLLNLLKDSIGIIFKYGRHLPKILRTGLKAMQSFKMANRFEQQLALAAEKSNRVEPFDKEDIEYFTSQLPEAEVYRFIEESLVLFKTLHDRKLIQRVKEIVRHLVSKMKARPNIYPKTEIAAFELGQNLIVEGDLLFESLTSSEQDLLFDMVVEIERDVLANIFS